MRRYPGIAAAVMFASQVLLASPEDRAVLVICSPGSPGTTAEAQPALDAFASAAEKTAGWPASSLGAVYFESGEAGRERLSQGNAALALVSPPFFFEFARPLSLQARLEAIPESGPGEDYSLVAKKGVVTSAASLSGWEIAGGAAFSGGFVREAILGDWGRLPSDARVTFSAHPLSALRRSASGERVAVLLDREQAAALGTLPFASDLEVVHRSRTFPAGLLCFIPNRLPPSRVESLVRALVAMKQSDAGRGVLKSLRLSGFSLLEADRLRWLTPPPASPGNPRP